MKARTARVFVTNIEHRMEEGARRSRGFRLRTSNIERPTSNIEWKRGRGGAASYWLLVIGYQEEKGASVQLSVFSFQYPISNIQYPMFTGWPGAAQRRRVRLHSSTFDVGCSMFDIPSPCYLLPATCYLSAVRCSMPAPAKRNGGGFILHSSTFDVQCSMFDVRCSLPLLLATCRLFDVRPPLAEN